MSSNKSGRELKEIMNNTKDIDDMPLKDKIMHNADLVSLRDVTCPICLCIFIQPVEMPCSHVICMPCYNETVTHANICCPVCRKRLSVWARKASKENKLVSQVIWKFMKEKFKDEVESREIGEDVLDPDEVLPCVPNHLFAEQGEIKSEFEACLAKENLEREIEQKREEEKSKDLIEKLKAEYDQEQKQATEDEQLARLVQSTPSPGKENKGFIKKKQIRGPLDSFFSSSQPMVGTPKISQPIAGPSRLSQDVNPNKSQSILNNVNKTNFLKEKNLIKPIQNMLKSDESESQSFSKPEKSRSSSPSSQASDTEESSLILALDESSCMPSTLSLIPTESETQPLFANCELSESLPLQLSFSSQDNVVDDDSTGVVIEQVKGEKSKCENECEDEAIAKSVCVEAVQTQSFDLSKLEGDFDPTFLEEQRKIAEQIEQEQKDRLLATKLQNEINKEARSVDRRKGSENGYILRPVTPKSAASIKKRKRSGGSATNKTVERGKQPSIRESFKKTKLNFD